MSDPVFLAAVARLDELKTEVKKLEAWVATYRDIATQLHIETCAATVTNTAVVNKRSRAKNPPIPSVIAAVIEIIKVRGQPMTRRELHTALKQRGMTINGVDPIKTLGTMLWRSGKDVLVQTVGRGYWLLNEPVPLLAE